MVETNTDGNRQDNLENEPLASEIYADLKASIHFKEKVIRWMAIIIVILVLALAATNIWHIYQWSQFETVTLDSGEGGYANYVGGENAGGIYNGEGYSTQGQEGK